jgi:hypothetical protein
MNTFNGIIATQTDHFRGTSTISIMGQVPNFPHFKCVDDALYAMEITGGVSGSFGVLVMGNIGGTTYILAGLTSITAAGKYMITPFMYDADGGEDTIETTITTTRVQPHALVPPSSVSVQSGVATHGISATITVSGVIRG